LDEASNEQVGQQLRDAELARTVMEYLVEFPEAMDNLKGIAEWWVMRRKVRVDVEDLTRVLGQLIEHGLLEKTGTGEGVRYRLKKQQT
jgi:hypothetical protein